MKLIGKIDGTKRGIFECPTCGNHKEFSMYKGTHMSVCSLICRPSKQCITHGHSKTKLYKVWTTMKTRCRTKPTYVRKNIVVCDEWKSFEKFEKWAFENGYSESNKISKDSLTIDRKDNNKNYEPSNCRWISMSENSSKDNYQKREVHQYTLEGKYIETYESTAKASKIANVDSSGIAKVCNGYRKKAGDFIWSYQKLI